MKCIDCNECVMEHYGNPRKPRVYFRCKRKGWIVAWDIIEDSLEPKWCDKEGNDEQDQGEADRTELNTAAVE